MSGLSYLIDLPWIVRGETESQTDANYASGLDPYAAGAYRPWPYFIRADADVAMGMCHVWIASEIQDLALAEAIVAEHNAALAQRAKAASVKAA